MFPQNEASSLLDVIFGEYLAMTRAGRHLNPGYRLSLPEMLKVQFAVEELKKNKPIQYIFNQADFYGLRFYVDKRVLIPRPETEELVEWIINDNGQLKAGLKILDIGTGSGCIAVSLKKNIPTSQVWAMDISAGAIDVAKQNAAKNEVELTFLQQDMLQVDNISGAPQFDIIVSNPPYVRESEKAEMSENVLKFEPAAALFVEDTDALVYYRQIAKIAMKSLSPLRQPPPANKKISRHFNKLPLQSLPHHSMLKQFPATTPKMYQILSKNFSTVNGLQNGQDFHLS